MAILAVITVIEVTEWYLRSLPKFYIFITLFPYPLSSATGPMLNFAEAHY
jgi:hypothetical protein